MKVLVPDASTKLSTLLTSAQRAQVEDTSPENQLERAWMFQIITSGATVYFENGAAATTSDSMPHAEGEGKFMIPAQGFSDLYVIGSVADVDMRILTC